MIYTILHMPDGDAFNYYDGMTQEAIAAMASKIWPGTTCEFISREEWISRLPPPAPK